MRNATQDYFLRLATSPELTPVEAAFPDVDGDLRRKVMIHRYQLLACLAASAALASPVMASAATRWQHNHPARAEINHRLIHQERRITEERREGDITAQQAHALRSEDHSIRLQERADARADDNHGHLNRGQITTLNQELNANSKAIGH